MLALGLAGLTLRQVAFWHSEEAVWQRAVEVSPLRPRAWCNLGRAVEQQGRFDEAVQDYYRAIALSFDPNRLHGMNLYVRLAAETNMATVFLEKGNLAAAGRQLRMVLRDPEWPLFAYAVYQHGIITALEGHCDEAKKEWAAAMGADTTLTHVPENLCHD